MVRICSMVVPLQLASLLFRASWQVPAVGLSAGVLVLAGSLLYWWGQQRRRFRAQAQAQQALIRSSIAANLHDELGSLLMRVHLEAEALLHQPQSSTAGLERLLVTTRAAGLAMRDVAWGLDASADTVHALQDRMRDLLDQLAPSTSLRLSLATEGLEELEELPVLLRQEIYLVFKEATTNVLNHAHGASYLAARLYRQHHNLMLEVQDDGVPAGAAGRSGMGLRNMAHRARAVGGQLEAAPRPDGAGFRVWFCAPLAPAEPPAWWDVFK